MYIKSWTYDITIVSEKMIDYEGHENLETAIRRKNFTKWVMEETFTQLTGDILEILKHK